MTAPYAVIGLGNPGKKYAGTRHNIGFEVVSALADGFASSSGSPAWTTDAGCQFAEVKHDGKRILLVLPQKFMNLSGEASGPLLRYFRVPLEQMLVVYDELDLDPGVIRLKAGGSAGGHHGVEDLIRHLGSESFARLRVGIGHPRRAVREGVAPSVSTWVLSRPTAEERLLLDKSVENAQAGVLHFLSHGLLSAQERVNRRENTG